MLDKRLRNEKVWRELIISVSGCTLTILASNLLSPEEGELISC